MPTETPAPKPPTPVAGAAAASPFAVTPPAVVSDAVTPPAATTPTATSAAGAGAFGRLAAAAKRPVAADSVAVFRIAYGLLVAYGSIRFLAKGWVDALYLEPANHLTYPGFEWVRPLAAPWMHLHMVALAGLGLCIAIGYRHRLAAALFVVGFTYTELIEASLYLNHYWFVTLAGLLLWLLPVGHRWSLDAALGRVEAAPVVPAGAVWALRAQVAVVYGFAGLAKLNPDWLFKAQPLRLWLADRTHLPLIGPLLDEPAVAYLASWWGVFFDCTVVGWLLWRRSRPWAYAALVVFHLATAALFQIGIFPWVMILAALVFFAPNWPHRLTRAAGVFFSALARTVSIPFGGAGPACGEGLSGGAGGGLAAGPFGGARPVGGGGQTGSAGPGAAGCLAGSGPTGGGGEPVPAVGRVRLALLGLLAVVQLVLPLRHYAIDGNVRWTEEGYYLAWRVMLTEKAGHVEYAVTDPSTGNTWTADPGLVLTDWQAAHAATRPDMVHATAHLIADHYRRQGVADPEVRANAWVTMNGRSAHRLIDPDVDLAAHSRTNPPSDWILDP